MIRLIYTFFVGLFVAIFIGMGIAVFYESPKQPEEPSWYGFSNTGKYEPNQSERDQEAKYNRDMKVFNETTMSNYNRNVSLLVLCCAVLVLAIALIFDNFFGIIADGILLGGIFTLLYGIGRGIAVDSNAYRFMIASLGLGITIGLGYIKFVAARPTLRSR